MLGKQKDKVRIMLGRCLNYPVFIYKHVVLGHDITIYGKLDLYIREQGLTIGNNVLLRSGLITNPLGGMRRIVFATYGGVKLLLGTMWGFQTVASKHQLQ